MTTFTSDHNRLFFIGDIHGVDNLKSVVHKMVVQFDIHDAALVVCGDCGFGFEHRGFYDNVYNDIKRRLENNNIEIFMLRGNHDDPSYFTGETRFDTERMHCVSDYDVIKCSNGQTILCIGGAISVDRKARTENESWWRNEHIVVDTQKIDEIVEKETINIVATHTSPSICPPFENKGVLMGWSVYDKMIVKDCYEERSQMTDIYNYITAEKNQPIKTWYYGHFHKHYDVVDKSCSFVGLTIEEIIENNV